MNQDVVTKLSEALDKLVHIRDAHSEVTPRIHRIVLDIDSVDPLDWLRSQSQNNCLYWQDRDDRERVAAVGEADVVTISSAHDLPTALQRITNPLLFHSHLLR